MSQVNQIEPAIIESLLKKAVYEQVEQEISDIATEEGIDFHKVQCLRLDYKNILKIDNLWSFQSLTKLQLDNNIIENIENIGHLKNLKWLDLSFNNISKISGLSSLVNLTDLTLFNNRITEIENLDELTQLTVISIGNNNITKLESIAYLTRFKNLRVLNALGNPLSKLANYKNYTIAHLRNLKYLDYRLVEEDALEAAKAQYIDRIMALEEEEKLSTAKADEAKRLEELNALYKRAHIKDIDEFFENMFTADPDFIKFKIISPNIINELKDQFAMKFNEYVLEIKTMALKKTQEKDQEIASFQKCVYDTLGQRNKTCDHAINEYLATKKKALKHILSLRDTAEADQAFLALRAETLKLSDTCISSEMVIVEQLEEVIKDFERNYAEICNVFMESCTAWFGKLREVETEHSEKMAEALTSAFDRLAKSDLEEMDDELRDVLSDKDAFLNGLTASHDFRQAKIDAQDDYLTTGLTRDIEETSNKVNADELKRNRDFVNEIIALIDQCNADIDQVEEAS